MIDENWDHLRARRNNLSRYRRLLQTELTELERRYIERRLSTTLWRIENNTFANDTVHRLPVDIGPNHFEFERVISGQLLTGLWRQQLALSLNI